MNGEAETDRRTVVEDVERIPAEAQEATSSSPHRSSSAVCTSSLSQCSSSRRIPTSTSGSCWLTAWSILWKSISILRSESASCPTAAWSPPGSARSAVSYAGGQTILPSEACRKALVTFVNMTASPSRGLMSPDTWAITIGRSDVAIPIHSRLVVNTAEAAIDAAIAGLGITRARRTKSRVPYGPPRSLRYSENSSHRPRRLLSSTPAVGFCR